ncbi:sushi domain-containing protein 1 isoform X3 [Gadus morhua]|nr:sushi domain-containing protein 1-like isoform X3 [Gadus morhua]XP_030215477.1 sushi domain-containing protein 1-like isoform X3 [Gadus morhua]
MYGFIGNGRTLCQDKDECQIGARKICGPRAACHNTVGSYACTCMGGFRPSNHRTSFTPNDGTYCQDIDECGRHPAVCGEGARCVNLEGDFECRCLLGYRAHNASDPLQPLRDKGSCKVVDCGPPPAGEAVRVLSTNGTAYGSVVLMGCKDGFLWRRGDNSSTCGPDGTWSRPAPLCQVVDCGPPPAGEAVQVLSTNGTAYGSVVLMGCKDGFQWRRGDNSSTCGPDGTWSRPAPLCQEIQCGEPLSKPHARMLWDNGTRVGSVLHYQCEEGYRPSTNRHSPSTNRSVCGEDGQWEESDLRCEEVSCGIPLIVPGTKWMWDSRSSAGSKVLYMCSASYYPESGQGSFISTCSETGEWGHVPLNCRARCRLTPSLAHAEVAWYNSSVTVHRCVDGYRSSRGSSVSVCGNAGQWQKATLKCIEIQCGEPLSKPHARMLWDNGTRVGSVLHYQCEEGYRPSTNRHSPSTNRSVCGEDGQWEESDLRCEEVSCGTPLIVPGTKPMWDGRSSAGSKVLYMCSASYYPESGQGSFTSTCSETGEWGHVPLNCRARCRLTPSLAHAEVAWYNSSVTVHRCVDGYRSSRGSSVSVCGNAGQWQKATLKCIEIQCGEPLSKPHARMLWDNGTRVGSVLHYQCEEGYRPSTNRHSPSTNRSVCGEDGQWEESDLRCEELSCGTPLIVPGTKPLWDGRSSAGSKVLYMCSASYYLESGQVGAVSTCSETGEWGQVPLNCRARCGPAPSLAHAEVAWYNSSVTVHRCLDGYRSSRGSSVSVCGKAGQWQKATLKCTEVKPAVNDLRVFNEKCLQWRAEKNDVDKEIYKVVFRGTRDYQGAFRHEKRQLLHSWDKWVEVCLSLLPATNYTISVIALSTRFTANITTNTSLQVPQAPLVLYRELDAPPATLRLRRSAHTLDAISVYQVVVVPLDGTVVFDCRSRGIPGSSQGVPPSSQYITGQFPLGHMNDTEMIFTVGDGRFHGGFLNAPLKRGTSYYVILRVVSQWKEAFNSSCVLWAKVTDTSYVMRVSSLLAACSVGGLLLVVLLVYIYIWFFKRRESRLNSQ